MNLELKEKNAIMTEGGKGIGRGIAMALADEAVNVAICVSGKEVFEVTKEELLKKGVKVCAESGDVGDTEKFEAFLNTVKLTFGTVDILVNNVSALSLDENYTDSEACINIELLASVKETRKVVPCMIASGTGSILFISSGSGLKAGSPVAYAASKAALISYSKTLSVQLVPRNIRVNMLAPGAVEFSCGLREMMKKHDKPFYEQAINTIPSDRMRRPDEIAKVATFFGFALC